MADSSKNEAYVRDIMGMDAEVQMELMQLIEKHMQSQPTTPLKPTNSTIISSPALYSTANTEMKRVLRENDALKDEVAHLNKENQTLRQIQEKIETQRQNLDDKLKELNAQQDLQQLQSEEDTRVRLNGELKAKEEEIQSLRQELDESQKVHAEIQQLRDEIDILQPAADKAAKLQATIDKYRERLEEATGVKEQLKQVQDTNTELVQQNLQLEAQVKLLPSMKRKVEEYKHASTDAAVQLSELQAELNRKDLEFDALKLKYDEMKTQMKEYHLSSKELKQQLTHMQFEQPASTLTEAMGTGISELNPEVSEKIARLEFENESLKLQVNGDTTERIDHLNEALDDANRLKKSFEDKYFQMKVNFEQKSSELDDSTSQLKQLNMEYTDLTREKENLDQDLKQSELHNENLQQELLNWKNEVTKLKEIQLQLEDQLKTTKMTLESEKKTFQQELTTREIQQRQLEMKIRSVEEKLKHETERHATFVAETSAAREEVNKKIENGMEELKRLKAKIVALQTVVTEKDKANHELELKAIQLSSKLRRVEKERAALSNQVRSRSGIVGTGPADTQLEIVRKELEQLTNEHKKLKERLQCTAGTTMVDDSSGYVDSLRHMEANKVHEEQRRRELILVNAKLVQEQKQLTTENESQLEEIQELRSRIKTYQLRQERRKQLQSTAEEGDDKEDQAEEEVFGTFNPDELPKPLPSRSKRASQYFARRPLQNVSGNGEDKPQECQQQ